MIDVVPIATGHGALLLILPLLIGATMVVEPMAYALKWDMSQPLDGHVADTSSFKQEAYPVTWESSQPLKDSTIHGSSFKQEAYPVKWESSQPLDDSTIHGSSFKPEAYPVKWESSQPLDDSTIHGSSFKPEAYPVKWESSLQPLGDPASHESFSKPEPHPLKLDTSEPHYDDPSAPESSFMLKPYPVKWDPPISAASDVADEKPARAHVHRIHVEPGMLFLRKSLFPGAILPEGTKFAGDAATQKVPRSFVSRAAADAIPFGSEHLDTILGMFRIPRGSKKADQVAATLRICEEPSPEPHTCATSRQAAAAFAAAALGTSEPPRAVVTVVRGNEGGAAAARYAVAPDGVARIGGGGGKAVVPCHPMPYPYMVHYCHRPAGVEALRVELTAAGLGAAGDGAAAAGGASATAIAMCHADTASWDARYFRMLNATRGEEICHFMPRGYVLWLPAGSSD